MSAVTTSGPMVGQVAVVTGGTSGIGLEVVRGLAREGASVVVVGRGAERARTIAQQVGSETRNANLTAVGVGDLALLSETTRLAQELRKNYPKIHVLVNNAGAYFRRRELTSEGHERTFALNVLSPFLLTSVLVPTLVESAPGRIVNISSAAHRGHAVDFNDIENTHDYGSGYRAYGTSKLELLLLTREFARRLTGSEVTANAVHPGFVRSGFAQNNGGGTAFLVRFFALLFGRSVRRGAETPVYVASDPTLKSVTGEYFDDRRPVPGSGASRDPAAARRLYEICRELTHAPEVPEPTDSAMTDA
jgi:retinol dehydrogenase 12